MRSFFLIVFTLISFAVFGQQDSGFTNKAEAENLLVNGKKEGKWVEHLDSYYSPTIDTNAPYYCLTIYKAGNACGITRRYYRNGKLAWIIPYYKGRENGLVKGYWENGNLSDEISYKNGKLNGASKKYKENGKLDCITMYKNNNEKGAKCFDENGKEIPIHPSKWKE